MGKNKKCERQKWTPCKATGEFGGRSEPLILTNNPLQSTRDL